jgi:hypothetical protein
MSGTGVTFYWGTETGALSSASFTADFSASALSQVGLGSDYVNEKAWGSFRDFVVWVNTTLTSGEVTSERDNGLSGPAKAGSTSYVKIPNGTSPGAATSGSNWTLTGTFAADASDPSFGGGGGGGSVPKRRALLGVGARSLTREERSVRLYSMLDMPKAA